MTGQPQKTPPSTPLADELERLMTELVSAVEDWAISTTAPWLANVGEEALHKAQSNLLTAVVKSRDTILAALRAQEREPVKPWLGNDLAESIEGFIAMEKVADENVLPTIGAWTFDNSKELIAALRRQPLLHRDGTWICPCGKLNETSWEFCIGCSRTNPFRGESTEDAG